MREEFQAVKLTHATSVSIDFPPFVSREQSAVGVRGVLIPNNVHLAHVCSNGIVTCYLRNAARNSAAFARLKNQNGIEMETVTATESRCSTTTPMANLFAS